ncbi:hypothetical protein JTE90_022726 [Oedothorax gibbosus]|uniref:Uncharacterized protein n=1 Tax=Oedothorax gibbosus TaxID=931172 RepID=A0AAV6UQS6_9ARAC|nr:hypothetical protein JTE90_022726 [Oedothorax gibbosus]
MFSILITGHLGNQSLSEGKAFSLQAACGSGNGMRHRGRLSSAGGLHCTSSSLGNSFHPRQNFHRQAQVLSGKGGRAMQQQGGSSPTSWPSRGNSPRGLHCYAEGFSSAASFLLCHQLFRIRGVRIFPNVEVHSHGTCLPTSTFFRFLFIISFGSTFGRQYKLLMD